MGFWSIILRHRLSLYLQLFFLLGFHVRNTLFAIFSFIFDTFCILPFNHSSFILM